MPVNIYALYMRVSLEGDLNASEIDIQITLKKDLAVVATVREGCW